MEHFTGADRLQMYIMAVHRKSGMRSESSVSSAFIMVKLQVILSQAPTETPSCFHSPVSGMALNWRVLKTSVITGLLLFLLTIRNAPRASSSVTMRATGAELSTDTTVFLCAPFQNKVVQGDHPKARGLPVCGLFAFAIGIKPLKLGRSPRIYGCILP